MVFHTLSYLYLLALADQSFTRTGHHSPLTVGAESGCFGQDAGIRPAKESGRLKEHWRSATARVATLFGRDSVCTR